MQCSDTRRDRRCAHEFLSASFTLAAFCAAAVIAWAPAPALAQPPVEDEEALARVRIQAGSRITVVDPAKLKATRQIYEAWAKPGVTGPVPIETMKAMYREGGFEVVKTLIENKVVSPDHSTQMADHRIVMIFETFQKVVAEYNDVSRKIRIHRSDSGNQRAGMSSDVDQTIFVEEYKNGRWVRMESLDVDVAERFAARFVDHGMPVEALDIATMRGKDKPPDFRTTSAQLQQEGKRAFKLHAAETAFELERNPGAYQETGAVVQQVQERVAKGARTVLRTGPDAVPIPIPRESLVSKKYPGFSLNHLMFLTIGFGENPADGPVGVREAFQDDAMRVMFDGLDPKLIRGHAYDAAVANFLEFRHHLEDKNPAVKYHLRGLDDSLYTLYRLEHGEDTKVEYAALSEEERRTRLAEIIGRKLVEPRSGHDFVDRWRVVFDISAELRQLHSDKKLNDDTARKAFEKLASEMAERDRRNQRPAKTADQYHQEARDQYNQRCQEFFMFNILATAQDRVAEWLSGDDDTGKHEPFERALDEQTLRAKMGLDGPEHDAAWAAKKTEYRAHFSFEAEIELLGTFRKLRDRPDLLRLILERAERLKMDPADVERLRTIMWKSSGIFVGNMKWEEMPRRYAERAVFLFQQQFVRSPREYGRIATNYILTETGWHDTPDGPRMTDLVKFNRTKVIHDYFTEVTKNSKFAGLTDRVMGRTFLNIGAVQAFGNVLVVYSDSGGDWEAARASMGRELLNILPIIGLIKGSYEAGSDMKGQMLLVFGVVSPTAGLILATYAIGEAGIALYGHEVSTPLTNEASDAIYRGYVGPTLYEFSREGAPEFFTNDDVESLAAVTSEVEDLQEQVASGLGDEDAKSLARASLRKHELERKRDAWDTWERNDREYLGGAIGGVGRHEEQVKVNLPGPEEDTFEGQPMAVPGSLLGGVKPIIFHPPTDAGPVDFTAQNLTPEEVNKLDEVMNSLDKPQDPLVFAEKKAEAQRLLQRRAAHERAADYLAAAGMNRELMHQIKRDSLWPHIEQDRASIVGMVSAEEYIRRWIAVRGEGLRRALADQGIDGDPRAAAIIEELKERLIADTNRSRQLWAAHQALTAAKEAALLEQVEREKAAFAAETLMLAAEEPDALLPPELKAFLSDLGLNAAGAQAAIGSAIRERSLPETAPVVEVTLRKVPVEKDEKEGTNSSALAMQEWEFRPDAKIIANTGIYVPPYFLVTYVLDPKAAREAATSRQHLGLPLDDETVQSLEAMTRNVTPAAAGTDPKAARFSPVALTFVFCTDVRIPERVVSETTARLPKLTSHSIVYPKGMDPGAARGYLMRSAAGGPSVETIPEGKLRISMSRYGVGWISSGELYNPQITVTSEAIGVAEKNKKPPGDVGYRHEGVMLTIEVATSPSGPWIKAHEHAVFPNRRDSSTYPAPNQRLAGFQTEALFTSGKVPYGPLYFRVAQQGGRWNPTENKPELDGPVEYSNIADPGTPRIWLPIDRDSKEKNPNGVMTMDQSNRTADPCLVLSGGYRFAGVHYTVSYGGFTGHMFDVADPFGKDKGRIVQNKINLPVISDGGVMSIRAVAPDGTSATREVQVVTPPEAAQQQRERIQKLLAEAQAPREAEQKRFEEVKATVERLENAPPRDPAKASPDTILQSQISLVQNRWYMAEAAHTAGPSYKLTREMEIASLSGDFPAALAAALQLDTHERAKDAAERVYLEQMIVLTLKRADAAREKADAVKEKRFRDEAEKHSQRLAPLKTKVYARATMPAMMAGNAEAYTSFSGPYMQELRAAHAAAPDFPGSFRAFEHVAWATVQATGDPKLGIPIMQEAWRYRVANPAFTREQHAKEFQEWERTLRPAWWPVGTPIN